MDTVKQGRTKVKEGDCVSVPNDHFRADYRVALQTVGVTEDRLYGWVVRLINGNQMFVVKWDVEGDETKTFLDKISIEAKDTPIQQPNPRFSMVGGGFFVLPQKMKIFWGDPPRKPRRKVPKFFSIASPYKKFSYLWIFSYFMPTEIGQN